MQAAPAGAVAAPVTALAKHCLLQLLHWRGAARLCACGVAAATVLGEPLVCKAVATGFANLLVCYVHTCGGPFPPLHPGAALSIEQPPTWPACTAMLQGRIAQAMNDAKLPTTHCHVALGSHPEAALRVAQRANLACTHCHTACMLQGRLAQTITNALLPTFPEP